ncbi:MAG: BatD family protein [Pseudomonadota bacterium]
MKTSVTLFLVLLLTSQSLWADVRASLSRQTIVEGDTVTLNIVTNAIGQGIAPDLSVLQQDFDILGSGSSQQTQIINGQRSESHQWHIDIAPKQGGDLTVPPIRVGAEMTQALTLSVIAQPDAVIAEAGQPVFIEIHLEPLDSPLYVQQQIRYRLQLFYRERLVEAGIDGPHVENALVERLGNDLQYQTTLNGQEYQVIERHYAIFPEQSGPLSISPVTFNGRLAGKSQQRVPSTNMNDMMERIFGNSAFTTPGKRIRLRGEDFTLDVQPRPAAYTGKYWLPAEQLALTDSWTSSPPEFRSGEPVTRTFTLEAKGLESTHLPDISLADSSAMRLYPEKPVYTNRTDGEWVIGSRQLSVAYVPSTTGLQTIPAIQLDWWDATEGKQKTVELPAWKVNVLPGEGIADPVPLAPITPKVADPGQLVKLSDIQSDKTSAADWLTTTHWTGLVGGVLLLMAGLFVLRRNKPDDKPAHLAAKPVKQQLRASRAAVQQACQDNNPAAAAKAMLLWAAATWPDDPPRNLGALMRRMSTGVNELQLLEQAHYGAAGDSWRGEALWRAFDQGLQQQVEEKPATRGGLSPLYPDWNP